MRDSRRIRPLDPKRRAHNSHKYRAPLDYLEWLNKVWGAGTNFPHQLVVKEEDHFETQLSQLGVKPEDVEHIIITPLKPYAIGGIDKFPNAQYHINRNSWAELFTPRYKNHPHDNFYAFVPKRLINFVFLKAWERMNFMKDEESILPGIDVFRTGVHYRSSVAVKINTKEGSVIFSDCFFRYEHITDHRLLGINENMYEALDSYERIRNEADILVPMYDPRVLHDHPGGKIGY